VIHSFQIAPSPAFLLGREKNKRALQASCAYLQGPTKKVRNTAKVTRLAFRERAAMNSPRYEAATRERVLKLASASAVVWPTEFSGGRARAGQDASF